MTLLNVAPPVAAQIRALPNEPGVYRFRDETGKILYVGRATALRSRVGSYWSNLGDRRHLRRMVPLIRRVEAVACASVHEATWLERNLLEHRKPRWNRTRGGMEVPVYVRLHAGPRDPRLTVGHERSPDGSFGPYLGGVRARVAVSALHRIYPLPYTADGMSGSGRDMAERRGVGPDDRQRLIDAISGVLQRNMAAIAMATAQLTGARREAADRLAFERAAVIQSELDALEWITETQRVTVDGGGDCTIAGWSDGLLTLFVVGDGRLRQWTTRVCGERAASAHIDASPQEWQEFAERAAELAARIRRAAT